MRKRAFTLIEVSAAIVLLAMCAVCFAQLVALTTAERAGERTRRMAVDLLQNVMESLAATEPDIIAAGGFDKTSFESLIERALPGGKILFDAKTMENGNVLGTITVSWGDGEKQPQKKVSMFRLYYKTPVSWQNDNNTIKSPPGYVDNYLQ